MDRNYTDLEDFSKNLANFLSENLKDESFQTKTRLELRFRDSNFVINIEYIPKIKFYMPMFDVICSDFFIKIKKTLYSKFIEYQIDTEKLKNHKPNFKKYFEVKTDDFKEALKILTQHKCYQKNKECPLVWIIYPDGFTEVRQIETNNGRWFSFRPPYDFSITNIVKTDNPYKKPKNDKVIGRVLRLRNVYNTDGYVYR